MSNPKTKPIPNQKIIDASSLITPQDLQQIELEIKKLFKVSFKYGIEQYFEGANYFNVYAPINYSDMLKAKLGN